MKTSFSHLRLAWRVGLVTAALVLASCVTDEQVKQIVSESNVASLSAQLDLGGVNADGPGAEGSWQEASKRIDAIVAANPEQKTTNAALRVRQAVMLLQNRQYNLATAAFQEASLDDLHSARDRAFKILETQLVWWYRTARDTEAIDFRMGESAQQAIDSVLQNLTADPKQAKQNEGIHDLLAAMRAFIGVKMAKDAEGSEPPRTYLKDAINRFAATLPAGETAKWLAQTDWPPSGMSLELAVSGTNRRHFTADSLITAAKKAMAVNTISGVQVSDAYFARRLTE